MPVENLPTELSDMLQTPPVWRVPLRPPGNPDTPFDWDWQRIPAIAPFRICETGELARYQTIARLCYDAHMLYVRFDCEDYDIWGVLMRHDDPIYDEEAVEIFISCGEQNPRRYYEIEVSPNGIVWDGVISNPDGNRATLSKNEHWNCQGLRVSVERDDHANRWSAILCIPWTALGYAKKLAPVWRANLFRIERPRNAPPEYSCWSPNFHSPADFHKPAAFGTLFFTEQPE